MLLRAVPDRSLDEILSGGSRSFYLSLAILPSSVREQMSIAYLLARAADTIADTKAIVPEQRLHLLKDLRSTVACAAEGQSGTDRNEGSIAELVDQIHRHRI